jgi:hypothetical protein
MRARVRITDLSAAQWARLQDRLMTSYHITAGAARVCAEFESGHPQDEVRHVEMPVQEFATVMTELNHLGYAAELRAEGEQLPPALQREINAAPGQVRRDCAFCHRERVFPEDDNHAPDCPYWTVGPGSLRPIR